MTVHVHSSISEITLPDGHHHLRDQKKRRKAFGADGAEPLDGERTWAFRCTPECEEHVVRTQEFASNHAGGVPLTFSEQQLREDLESKARVETARMSQALAQLASERVAAGATA